jgi:hypothetical protein
MDRISDEQILVLLSFYDNGTGKTKIETMIISALVELRERREAEKEPKPEPYDADWTSLECPKCHHTNVVLDKFGYRCFTSGCGWTKDEPVIS